MKGLKRYALALLAAGMMLPACATSSTDREVEIEVEQPGPDYEEEYETSTKTTKTPGGQTATTTKVDHEIEEGSREYELATDTRVEQEADGEVEIHNKVALEEENKGYEHEKTTKSHSKLEEDGDYVAHGRTTVETEKGDSEYEHSSSYKVKKDYDNGAKPEDMTAKSSTSTGSSGTAKSDTSDTDMTGIAVFDVEKEKETAVLGEQESREAPTVHFPFDKSSLDASDKAKLRGYLDTLRNNPDATIVIEGHTDERGSNAYNMALGERRAKAVKDYLTSQGIDASRLNIVSYGEERPVVPNADTESGYQMNRRAEVEVD